MILVDLRGPGSEGQGLGFNVLHLAMYTVPNLLVGMKVRVIMERNGGRTRTEEDTGGRELLSLSHLFRAES